MINLMQFLILPYLIINLTILKNDHLIIITNPSLWQYDDLPLVCIFFLALHGMDDHSLVLTIASGAGSVGGGVCMPVEGSDRSSCIISRWS
jgi:hypothetical protein